MNINLSMECKGGHTQKGSACVILPDSLIAGTIQRTDIPSGKPTATTLSNKAFLTMVYRVSTA